MRPYFFVFASFILSTQLMATMSENKYQEYLDNMPFKLRALGYQEVDCQNVETFLERFRDLQSTKPTALSLAAYMNRLDLVNILIHIDDPEQKDISGRSAFDYASKPFGNRQVQYFPNKKEFIKINDKIRKTLTYRLYQLREAR